MCGQTNFFIKAILKDLFVANGLKYRQDFTLSQNHATFFCKGGVKGQFKNSVSLMCGERFPAFTFFWEGNKLCWEL
jgi:hypothetical protein